MRSAFSVQDFSPIFWYKYYVVCAIPLCMSRTFFLHFCLLCFVRDALLPLLHFTTGDFFLFNYYPCKTLRRTIGLACGFLLELKILSRLDRKRTFLLTEPFTIFSVCPFFVKSKSFSVRLLLSALSKN